MLTSRIGSVNFNNFIVKFKTWFFQSGELKRKLQFVLLIRKPYTTWPHYCGHGKMIDHTPD